MAPSAVDGSCVGDVSARALGASLPARLPKTPDLWRCHLREARRALLERILGKALVISPPTLLLSNWQPAPSVCSLDAECLTLLPQTSQLHWQYRMPKEKHSHAFAVATSTSKAFHREKRFLSCASLCPATRFSCRKQKRQEEVSKMPNKFVACQAKFLAAASW